MRLPILPFARALLSVTIFLGPVCGQGPGGNPSLREQTAPLSPQELFKRLAPSVFVVEALDRQGSVVAFGSGVSIGPDLVITNNHVIEDGAAIRVRQGSKTRPALVTLRDDDHDLCLLGVTGLSAVPVSVRPSSSLAVGERVYSIGAPEGLELTFSEGIISGFRKNKQARVIQTTAAVSQGSSGGGLFDVQGRLVGITTFSLEEGQNLNFALPGDLVLALRKSTTQRTKAIGFRLDQLSDIPQERKKQPVQASDWRQMGDEAFDARRWEEAIGAYKEYVRLKPKDAAGWKGLGNAYYEVASQARWFSDEELADYGAAAGAYEEALRLKPDDADVWKALGDSTDLSQPDKAMHSYQEAIRLKPEDEGAHRSLGSLYKRKGNLNAAIIEFREVLRLVPQDADMHSELGDTLKEKGNLDAAIIEYREAIRLEPDQLMWHYDLGEALKDRHDFEAAIQQYRGAIRLNAEGGAVFYLPHLELGICDLLLGERDSALEEYKILADKPGATVDAEELFDSIISNTTAPGASGVVGSEFAWDLPAFKTGYSFSLHNLLQESVKEVHYIVIFYGPDDKPIDSKRGVYKGAISAGLAARVTGEQVDSSVGKMATRVYVRVLGLKFDR